MRCVLKKKLIILLAITFVFVSLAGTFSEVNAAPRYKLSSKSIVIENGKTYKIKLKGVSGKVNTKRIKWKSSKKSVATVERLSGNKALIKAKKPGQTTCKR